MSSEITAAQKSALLKLPGFKDIQKQYAKESKMEGGRIRRMRGRGFWDDVGAWFVQAGKDVNQFLKDTKIVSNVAAYALPILGAMGGALLTVNPLGATAGGIAGKSAADYIRSQGYGKTHGGKMMRGGELSNKLVINPPGQRLMGKGIFEDVLYTAAPLASLSISNAQNALSKVKKMTGKGSGKTFGFSGQEQQNMAPVHTGIMRNMKGSGMAAQSYKLKQGNVHGMKKTMIGNGGIPYGSISSEFGNVQF
jgi:hypothetical protein